MAVTDLDLFVIEQNSTTYSVTAARVADYMSGKISTSSFHFKGEADVTGTAPSPIDEGDIYLNNTAGTADASWVGIDGQSVLQYQTMFYTTGGEWVLGAIQDPTGVPDATDVTRGVVVLSDAPGTEDAASGGTAVTPKALQDVKDNLDALGLQDVTDVNAETTNDVTVRNAELEILNDNITQPGLRVGTAGTSFTVDTSGTVATDGEISSTKSVTAPLIFGSGENMTRVGRVTVSSTEPGFAVEGDSWYRDTGSAADLLVYDGTSWIQVTHDGSYPPAVVVSPTEPPISTHKLGDLWYETTSGDLYCLVESSTPTYVFTTEIQSKLSSRLYFADATGFAELSAASPTELIGETSGRTTPRPITYNNLTFEIDFASDPMLNGIEYNERLYHISGSSTSLAWTVVGGDSADLGNDIVVGPTPPSTPIEGTMWFDTEQGNLYIWYIDSDSSQWISAAPAANASNLSIIALPDLP